MFLVAHAIELALKAYLRDQRLTVKELQRMSHDLSDCWRVATDNGIGAHVTLTQEELGILRLIGDLHASTQLRYIRTGFKDLPVFGPLEQLARKLLDVICPLVGYR